MEKTYWDYIFSAKEEKAIKNMIGFIYQGRTDALKDLIYLLRVKKDKRLSQGLFEDLMSSGRLTHSQQKIILAQKDLYSENEHKKRISNEIKGQSTSNMIAFAKRGDMEALLDMIKILKKRSFSNKNSISEDIEIIGDEIFGKTYWAERNITMALVEIFLSNHSTPEQKKLIWGCKDLIVAIEHSFGETDNSDTDEYGKIRHQTITLHFEKKVTLFNLIQPSVMLKNL